MQVLLIRTFIVSINRSDTVAQNKRQAISMIIYNKYQNKYQNCSCIDLPRIKNIFNSLKTNMAIFSFGKNSNTLNLNFYTQKFTLYQNDELTAE